MPPYYLLVLSTDACGGPHQATLFGFAHNPIFWDVADMARGSVTGALSRRESDEYCSHQ